MVELKFDKLPDYKQNQLIKLFRQIEMERDNSPEAKKIITPAYEVKEKSKLVYLFNNK